MQLPLLLVVWRLRWLPLLLLLLLILRGLQAASCKQRCCCYCR
jgi:hypothetical protein